mmetsp:Transcript_6722/g.28179  ORF Transcript_6722/g.28179 Transcript_6722/m.28179 type:complete len:245 (-) Transcript_6722:319-1053(-)
MDHVDRRLDALDLSVPRGKPVAHRPPTASLSVSPSTSSVADAPTTTATFAPRLDTRRARRSKLSTHRREAKARRYDDAASARAPRASGVASRTLQIRVHAVDPGAASEEDASSSSGRRLPGVIDEDAAWDDAPGSPSSSSSSGASFRSNDDRAVVHHRTRQWGGASASSKHKAARLGGGPSTRKAMSMPPQRTSHFVVVDDEVDAATPVCGIDLGPFLSWLSCMPSIPEDGPPAAASSSASRTA